MTDTLAPETTDAATDGATDTIEAGKRMVRARGASGLSLGERLVNQFHRFTWRTPLHALRLRGRYPLKLLAVPKDPIPGDAERGRAIIDGTIRFRAESLSVEDLDFTDNGISPAFADHLQSFGFLRDLTATGDRAEAAAMAERLMRIWLIRHSEHVTNTAWRADLWAKRTLNWAAHAPLILSSTDLVYRSQVLNALARGGRHLDRVASRAPIGVQRVIAAAGLCAAGLLMPGGEPRRTFGESALVKAIDTAFTGDGGSICRSPQNLAEAVAVLSMLAQVYEARRVAMPAEVVDMLDTAVPALMGVTMGDGGLSSWQGGAASWGDEIAAIITGSGVRARPQRQARDWGYQRISLGDTVIVFDAAPPPVTRVAESGCASTLAFELSDGPNRIVVNCGGSRYVAPTIPAPLIQGLRTTAAHSTLTLADSNSTAIHSDGSLGRGVNEVELDRIETEVGSKIEASHDGYARRFGLTHKRSIAVSPDGKEVRADDVLLPTDRARKPQASPFAVRFHLGPKVEVSPTADGGGALLRITEGPLWQFRCTGGTLSIDESLWINGDGALLGTQQLVVSGDAPPGGASVSWTFKRIG
jgi:uncharacterized heparinase superfamily protein